MNYSIDDISHLTGLSKYTLRYYEKEGLTPKISRNASGYRVYSEENLEWLNFLLKVKQTGIKIKKIKKFSKIMLDSTTIPERKKMLLEHKQNIINQQKELQSSLEAINKKLKRYSRIQGKTTLEK